MVTDAAPVFKMLVVVRVRLFVGGPFVDVVTEPVVMTIACAKEANVIEATKATTRAAKVLFMVGFPWLPQPKGHVCAQTVPEQMLSSIQRLDRSATWCA